MKNKKGFTLVELVTVIALLGVIMLLVVPNVVESYSRAKKTAFYNDLLSLYSKVTSDYITRYAEDTSTPKVFCKSTSSTFNEASMEVPAKFNYRVEVDQTGQIIDFKVTDGEFGFTMSGADLKKSDIVKDDIEELSSPLTITCPSA